MRSAMRGLLTSGPLLLLLTLIALWVGSAYFIVRTTPLKTGARYLHALLSFPLILILLPVAVYVTLELTPHATTLVNGIPELTSLPAGARLLLGQVLSVAASAALPALLFFRYRRFIDRREARTLERLAVPGNQGLRQP